MGHVTSSSLLKMPHVPPTGAESSAGAALRGRVENDEAAVLPALDHWAHAGPSSSMAWHPRSTTLLLAPSGALQLP